MSNCKGMNLNSKYVFFFISVVYANAYQLNNLIHTSHN